MSSLATVLWFLLGLGLLVKGADFFVTGASRLAGRLGVSKLIIGLTVVAFGTSAPEFAVNLVGAFTGNADLAIGNVIGSNIANLGLILGIAALVCTLRVHSVILYRELPFLFLTSLALLLALVNHRLQPGAGGPEISRSEGLTLLLFFAVYLYYLFAGAIRKRTETDALTRETDTPAGPTPSLTAAAGCLVLGLAMVMLGGQLVVSNGTLLATALGISKAFVGLVMVAVGTSLPEVATALTAARRGESDLVLGNVIGSNIFNTVAVLGLTAAVRPLPFHENLMQDVAIMFIFSVIAFVLTFNGRRVDRWEGSLLLFLYACYVGFAIVRG